MKKFLLAALVMLLSCVAVVVYARRRIALAAARARQEERLRIAQEELTKNLISASSGAAGKEASLRRDFETKLDELQKTEKEIAALSSSKEIASAWAARLTR